MSGTDVAYGTICLRACYAMPGTDVAYLPTCLLPRDLALKSDQPANVYLTNELAPPGGWLTCVCFHVLWSSGNFRYAPTSVLRDTRYALPLAGTGVVCAPTHLLCDAQY
eukprot:970114-Rhodomonas_salina.5